jgi:hypothetical protein
MRPPYKLSQDNRLPEELCKYAERPRSSDAESDIVDQFVHFEADLIEGTLLAKKHSRKY